MAADIFSSTISEYSAGEHLPRLISTLLHQMVFHDAKVSSVNITGYRG